MPGRQDPPGGGRRAGPILGGQLPPGLQALGSDLEARQGSACEGLSASVSFPPLHPLRVSIPPLTTGGAGGVPTARHEAGVTHGGPSALGQRRKALPEGPLHRIVKLGRECEDSAGRTRVSGSPRKRRLSRVEQRGGHTTSPPLFQTLPVRPSATTPQSMASRGRPWSQTVHGGVSAHQCVQTATQASEKLQTETRSHSSLDDLRGHWNPEGWLRPKRWAPGAAGSGPPSPHAWGSPSRASPRPPAPGSQHRRGPATEGRLRFSMLAGITEVAQDGRVEWSPRCLASPEPGPRPPSRAAGPGRHCTLPSRTAPPERERRGLHHAEGTLGEADARSSRELSRKQAASCGPEPSGGAGTSRELA